MNDTDTMHHDVAAIQKAATPLGWRPGSVYGDAFLRHVPQPTLLLWGEADVFGGIDLARRTCAAMPNAKLLSFPAAGHLPWLDDPEKHAAAVRNFLRPH